MSISKKVPKKISKKDKVKALKLVLEKKNYLKDYYNHPFQRAERERKVDSDTLVILIF